METMREASGISSPTRVITTSFPPLKNAGLGLAYGIYTTFAVLSLLFVLKFIRETKGVELEDMPGNEPAEVT
jgi:MFS transporter, SP family, sugar:H+ symporter